MNPSRRSFLAAIAGALASQVLPKRTQQQLVLDRFDHLWEDVQRACKGPVVRPFYLWEWTELSGNAERLEILPPPLPPEMWIEAIGINVDARARAGALCGLLQSWEIRLRLHEKDWGSIYVTPARESATIGTWRPNKWSNSTRPLRKGGSLTKSWFALLP